MNLIKKFLKKKPFWAIIVWLYGKNDSRKIRKSEAHFNRILPNYKEPPFQEVYARLVARLKARSIAWPPEKKDRPIHVLYVSIPGNWERHNIPPELKKIGKVTCYYAIDRGIQVDDRLSARKQIDTDILDFIKEIHAKTPIDMMLSYLSGAEISSQTIEEIKALGIATFSFHWDDRLYFHGRKLENQWAGPAGVCNAYDLNLTNVPESLIKYEATGALAIFWPEAANPDYHQPISDLPFLYDVSFIGGRYGVRDHLITYLKKQGIKVAAFGRGWGSGAITEAQMLAIYAQSRINLGFGFVGFTDQFQCIKLRDFEVPACGTVYLTSHNDTLSRLYRLDEEIVTYHNKKDCVEKIIELLGDPKRCEKIRIAARKAILERNTWEQRVRQLIWGN